MVLLFAMQHYGAFSEEGLGNKKPWGGSRVATTNRKINARYREVGLKGWLAIGGEVRLSTVSSWTSSGLLGEDIRKG